MSTINDMHYGHAFGSIAKAQKTVNQDALREWCDALRSGKYAQVTTMLCGVLDPEVPAEAEAEVKLGHCCLGVAAEIFGPRCGVERVAAEPGFSYGYKWTSETGTPQITCTALPGPVAKLLGFLSGNPRLLRPGDNLNETAANWNDMKGATFAEIADMIEYTYLDNDKKDEES